MLYIYRGFTWTDVAEKICDESLIRKYYAFMIKNDIINTAYEIIRQKYGQNRRFKHLYVDSASMINKNNSLLAEYYYKIKSKRQLKLHIICDKNKIPLSYEFSRGAQHDSKSVLPLIKKLDPNILTNDVTLVGDKVYILKKSQFVYNAVKKAWSPIKKRKTNKRKNKKNKKITVICEPKSNQKNKLTEKEEKVLKKRCIVENSFCRIRRSFKKMDSVWERKIECLNANFKLVCMHMMVDLIK